MTKFQRINNVLILYVVHMPYIKKNKVIRLITIFLISLSPVYHLSLLNKGLPQRVPLNDNKIYLKIRNLVNIYTRTYVRVHIREDTIY